MEVAPGAISLSAAILFMAFSNRWPGKLLAGHRWRGPPELLEPIMVRTYGRAGSTLLMQILASSQSICMERQYPFEHRYLTYADNLARIAGLPADSARLVKDAWNNDVMFRNESALVGCLPYGNLGRLDRKRLSRQLLISIWGEFSRELRFNQGLGSQVPAYYAEKTPPEIVERVHTAMPARQLFLIRDPRDELVSIRSFNRKRGFNAFGWLEQDDDASYARRMCRNRKQFLNDMVTLREDRRNLRMRYEDLIQHGDAEVGRLEEWLGISLDGAAGTSDEEIRKQHMTSTSADASVERWRNELSDQAQKIFQRGLAQELMALGYSFA